MRLKNAFLYYLSEIKRPVFIFYGILFAFYLLDIVLSIVYYQENMQITGIDFATAIFLFIVGCTSVHEGFPMMLQHSVSRKTMFKSRIAVAFTVPFIMSVVNALFIYGVSSLLNAFMSASDSSASVFSVFQAIYFQAQDNSVFVILWSILLMFCINLFVYMFGTLLSLIFYRVNTLVKVLIAAGIPALLIFVLPIVDTFFTNGQLVSHILHFISTIFGLSAQEVWKGCVSLFAGTVLAGFISWLVMRRMPVKSKF